ncbi:hypothetical protein PHYSODRAFT_246726 [Phytophthora sojae]|uniref:Uncharacterized protein n=1 Tax=Phytophthora sojae (strain P6497) TaxID=1094619 RepID=G4YGV3_PHYSP|nr:hypothetical protein PHYSODRAFT_246726 [Phytophthora sojae]EGZ27434.1 hypothetical protein PHYSODRAFT_246726 [Phytophthora sojae]|eukprot:XP_009514709.1 hypothetical protein PHYSODRAFT_246726 [Phytophthora sojae]
MGAPEQAATTRSPSDPAPSKALTVSRRLTSLEGMPRAFKGERSASCPERFAQSSSSISFESEAFRLQTEARIAQLIRTANSPMSSTSNALLAQKALKYRHLDV